MDEPKRCSLLKEAWSLFEVVHSVVIIAGIILGILVLGFVVVRHLFGF